jgi:hypothetical protein
MRYESSGGAMIAIGGMRRYDGRGMAGSSIVGMSPVDASTHRPLEEPCSAGSAGRTASR